MSAGALGDGIAARFLALVVLQAAHSLEEYAFRLYEVFPPARWLSGLVSDDRALGFAILNAAIVALGAGCWVIVVRPGRASARAWAWGWVALEIGNGIGHPLFALLAGGYFPGVATAPFLLVAAVLLARALRADRGVGSASV